MGGAPYCASWAWFLTDKCGVKKASQIHRSEMANLLRFNGRVALVTGAGGGEPLVNCTRHFFFLFGGSSSFSSRGGQHGLTVSHNFHFLQV